MELLPYVLTSKYRSLRTGVVSSGVEIGVHALLSFTPLPRSKSQIFTGDTWNGGRRKNTYKSNHWGNKSSLMKSKQIELQSIGAPYWEIHKVYFQALDLDVQYLRSNTERQWVMSKATMPKIEKIFAFWCLQQLLIPLHLNHILKLHSNFVKYSWTFSK